MPSIEVRSSRLLLVLIVVVVSACGGGNEPDSVRTDEPDEPELVVCGPSGPSFPRAALDTLPDAPEPDASMAEAMQAFLGSDEGQFWPQDGWRVLSAGPAEALLFVRADGQFWFQSLEQQSGTWTWAGSSARPDCPLRVPVPSGFNAVEWVLDPDAGPPTPDSTEVVVLATEVACASGEPMGDRLSGPEVEATSDAIRIGFLAEPQTGDAECPGNPATPVTVQLGEPLGDRQLVDLYDLQSDLSEYL